MSQDGPVDFANQLSDPDLPNYYFNGFGMSISTGDVVIIAHRNGKPSCVINLSYTVAKSLSERLSALLGGLERGAGQSILTTDKISLALEEVRDAKNPDG